MVLVLRIDVAEAVMQVGGDGGLDSGAGGTGSGNFLDFFRKQKGQGGLVGLRVGGTWLRWWCPFLR